MKVLEIINDPVYVSKDLNLIDRFFMRFIKDERDLPFIHLIIRTSAILMPLALLLYMPFVTGWVWWVIAIAYIIAAAVCRTPFGLMIHCVTHRQLFKNKYKKLIYYFTWIVGPFLGLTPETYFSHHIGMHHVENNMPEDESSTMYYQRDSVKDFFKYYINFFFTGLATLINYLNIRNRKKLARRAFSGEMYFFLVCIGLSFINFPATFVVFIFTFLCSRLMMLLGNWTQHSFIDQENPDNPYKNSITCINVRYNRIAWNDGYHASHHVKPTMHWTEHPKSFINSLDEYVHNRAIIFDGLDFGTVFFNLMRKRYDVLARHFVNLHGVYKNEEEVIKFLKSRTKKFYPDTLLTPALAK